MVLIVFYNVIPFMVFQSHLMLFSSFVYLSICTEVFIHEFHSDLACMLALNSCPAEPGYTLPLQTV